MSTQSKGAERRSLYRTSTTRSDVSFEILTNDGNSHSGEVVGATVEGTGALFSQDTAPRLEMGEQIKLVFSAPDLREQIEIDATVASCLVQSTRWRYGFRFQKRVEAPENAATPFYRIFNRRRTHRLVPEAEHFVPISLDTTEGAIEGLMRDISAIGAGVVSEAALSVEQMEADSISLSFHPPGGERALCFGTRVRHHIIDEGLHRYGLEFDQATTNDFEAQQREIMQYVMRSLLQSAQEKIA